jgi:hypothetical protein
MPGWAFYEVRHYKEKAGFDQEKKQKKHGGTHLNHPGGLYCVGIFSPPVLSRSEKIRG